MRKSLIEFDIPIGYPYSLLKKEYFLPRVAGGMRQVPKRWKERGVIGGPAMRELETPWDVIRTMLDMGQLDPDDLIHMVDCTPDATFVYYLKGE